jgi:hypothetical protein
MKTISRAAIKAITKEANHAAYAAANQFGEHFRFEQGFADSKHTALFARSGYLNYNLDFIPLSEILEGKILKNKHRLHHVQPIRLDAMLRDSFVQGKAWARGDTVVTTRDYLRPILAVIAKYADSLDVFAGVYRNRNSMTDVFSIYVKLKDVEVEDQLCWEITIDDVDLVKPHTRSGIHSLFK